MIPWILALLLAGAGAGYFFWRQRSRARLTLADGYDALSAPEPARSSEPLQRSAPPRPAAPAKPAGVVSTRIRPWLDIVFAPTRCTVADDKVTIEFDVMVRNSGAAPARDVLVEVIMFNAGPTQDQDIGAFFAHPAGKGDRVQVVGPLKHLELRSAVTLNHDQLRHFEVAGRRLFVPLIAFNVLYRWSAGEGQSSASYLVGRDTKGEKMAPFRLDLGPRIFRSLAARDLNIRVRK